jgi:hypothetical protein
LEPGASGKANQDRSPSPKDNSNNSNGMQNVIALGVVSFFTDFSTEIVLGVLPLFVVSSLGASRAILGTIEGSSELTSYLHRRGGERYLGAWLLSLLLLPLTRRLEL